MNNFNFFSPPVEQFSSLQNHHTFPTARRQFHAIFRSTEMGRSLRGYKFGISLWCSKLLVHFRTKFTVLALIYKALDRTWLTRFLSLSLSLSPSQKKKPDHRQTSQMLCSIGRMQLRKSNFQISGNADWVFSMVESYLWNSLPKEMALSSTQPFTTWATPKLRST